MDMNNTKLQRENFCNKNIIIFPVIVFAIFMIIYFLSIKITIDTGDGKFMNRTWYWSQYFIAIGAFIVLVRKFEKIKLKYIIIGAIYTLIACTNYIYSKNLIDFLKEGFVIIITFIAACLLYNKENVKSSMVEKDRKYVFLSILIGLILSIPFAIINFIYFRITIGTPMWHNPLESAFYALQPAFAEEIVFRFFIMNLFIYILNKYMKKDYALFISMFLCIIPHSLIHFSELWVVNPIAAIVMLILTSVLFGLPMAYLQYRRDLETSIIFHLSIDFVRFLGGY